MALPGMTRDAPSAPATPRATCPSRPRNCRRDAPVAARSAASMNFSNTGYLLRGNRTINLHVLRAGPPRLGVVGRGPPSGAAEHVAQVLPAAGDSARPHHPARVDEKRER